MPKISITLQGEGTKYYFTVARPNDLTQAEANRICKKMNVWAIFVNGKFYRGRDTSKGNNK